MAEMDSTKEKCWEIETVFPALCSISYNRIQFAPMVLSYDVFENIGYAIDADRVHALPGNCGSFYDYKDGRCDFTFIHAHAARQHALRLEEKNLIRLE
jgi:hypothetical protein